MTIKADEKQTSREGVVFASPVQYGDLSAFMIKLDVDASDAIKALKAIQREARAATRALRELEAKIERMQKIEVEMDGRKIGEIVTPSARDLQVQAVKRTLKDGKKHERHALAIIEEQEKMIAELERLVAKFTEDK